MNIFVVVAVAVIAIFALLSLSPQVNDVLDTRYESARAKPWRLVEAVTPETRQVQIAADGWACGDIQPKANSTITYGAASIAIEMVVRDAASNCIQSKAVFVHLTVELAQAVGNRQLVDPNAVTPIGTPAE